MIWNAARCIVTNAAVGCSGDAATAIKYENCLGLVARSLRRVMDAQAAKARAAAVATFARSDVAKTLVQEERQALVVALQQAFESADKDGTGMMSGARAAPSIPPPQS